MPEPGLAPNASAAPPPAAATAEEIAALAKHSCPACGADAAWNAAKQALVCGYCGTVSPAKLASDGSLVEEKDLATALRNTPAHRKGWEAERVAVKCQSCQAISLFDPKRVAQNCEFCGSPQVVAQTEGRSPIVPESVLPFKIPEATVRESVRRWYASRWFAPNRLNKLALTDRVHGLYVPYWTFDSQVAARWQAEAGDYYYENETRNGKTVRVQKTRWRHVSGSLEHFFDDVPVPATRGIDHGLLHEIEPFPSEGLLPYDPGYVAGWVVEQYQIDLVAAAEHARAAMDHQLRGLCAAQIRADTHRNLQVQADYSAQTFKHVLAPVWLVSYTYGAKVFQVVVNGFTGKIAGKHPWSWVKILFAALAVITILLIVLSVAGN